MRYFFFVIALSLHVGYGLTPNSPSSSTNNGSHNLLLDRNNSSVRAARCTPCGQDVNYKRPVSNHLDPQHRGNGADNLGYDWSPMAWGGLAYQRRPKMYMGGHRGMKMMPGNWGRNSGNTRVVCDTCRSYWDDGRSGSRGYGRQFDMGPNYGDMPGTWNGDKMRGTQDYETRVISPAVGVLVKPGSRIAYIPSKSGEMYWDGVSGGGTRWDGFSNGISWIGNGVPSGSGWDRMDADPRDEKPGYDTRSQRPENDYRYGSNGFGLWDNQKGTSWSDDRGRGYYFSNGVSNEIDPQWRDLGYASNWHYGNTNQNGWNGNNMKWNYGKQWSDNDRAANQFYFNAPQDRTYSPNEGHRFQYGNQYPNYQPTAGYPTDFRPRPSWPAGGGYRPNDRFPSSFQQGNYEGDDNRPWDYTSRDQLGHRRPGLRPEWGKPGPGYPSGGKFETGKFPEPQRNYNKFSPSDNSNQEKNWAGPSGYGPAKPGGGGFPYGGNRYPEESGSRPGFPMGGNLFYPNEDNRQPSYPEPVSGNNRPTYPSDGSRPGGYPSSGNQIGTYSGGNGSPSGESPARPTTIYTGGKPLGGTYPSGSIQGGFPSTGGPSGGYPSGYPGSSSGFPVKGSGGYPGTYSEINRPTGYPGSGSRPGGYYSSGGSGNYPGGAGGYPSSGSGSYPSGSSGSYPSGGPGSYPSGGSGSYPSGSTGNYPSGRPGGYPSGGSGSYPSGSSGSYPSGGSGGYPSGGSGGYPSGGSGGYPSGGSGSYPSGGSGGYPSGGSGSYPNGGSGSYPNRGPGSYTTGGSGSYPTRGSGSYPNGGSGSYPNGGFSSRPNYFGQGNPYPTENAGPGFYPAKPGGNGASGYPDGYPSGGNSGSNRPQTHPGAFGYPQGSKNPSKGYYTGFITELGPEDVQLQYGGKNTNYYGGSHLSDKNSLYDKNRDKYFYGGDLNRKDRFPGYPGGGSYPLSDKNGYDRIGDYNGQSGGKGPYPGGFPPNHRLPGAEGGNDYDKNQGSTNDKNAWNYGQNDHKEGIYRRSGGSYPPYRGGQYYTSSYLASMSTTAGSTSGGSEPKTQSATKADEVTQPTPDSS